MIYNVSLKIEKINHSKEMDGEELFKIEKEKINNLSFHIPNTSDRGKIDDLYYDFYQVKHDEKQNITFLDASRDDYPEDFFYSFLNVESDEFRKEINFLKIKINKNKVTPIDVFGEILQSQCEEISLARFLDNHMQTSNYDNFKLDLIIKKQSKEKELKKTKLSITLFKNNAQCELIEDDFNKANKSRYLISNVIFKSSSIFQLILLAHSNLNKFSKTRKYEKCSA
jgi:hypothetical protein